MMGQKITIGIDTKYLAEMSLNPSGPEADSIYQIIKDAADFSAGKQNYFVVPMAYTEGGEELFSVALVDITKEVPSKSEN